MSEIVCPKCHMSFWLTYAAKAACGYVFCPNGHKLYQYSGALDLAHSQPLERIEELRAANEKMSRSNYALKGVITRMKNKS